MKNTTTDPSTPIGLPRGLQGAVLTNCHIPGRGRDLPGGLPTVDVWRPWLEQLVADPTTLPGCTGLKYSKSGDVFRVNFALPPYSLDNPLQVVSRRTRSERGGGILSSFRTSRASRNFQRALRLLQVGIDTPVPLVWIERTAPPRSSWLVTEFVADVVDLDQIVLTLLPQMDRRAWRKARNGVVDAVVELLVRLDRAGLHHRDLKASNILMTNWEGRETRLRPVLVDLDGLHPRRWWSPGERRQPLVRLAASLRDYPGLTRTDFARFLLRYLTQVGRPRAEWKTHFRRLTRDATQYLQRSQLRKTHKLDGFTGA
jgi:tRNA A-37 threonylcarbamoyl transferase component Bud32